MVIQVEQLSHTNDDELVEFLDQLGKSNPSVLGYHYPFYRDRLVEIGLGEPCYLGARRGGRVVGVLPAFTKATDAGRVYSSLPFFGPNAGVLYDCRTEGLEIHQALLKALRDRAESDCALSCSIYTPFMFDQFEWYDAAFPQAVRTEKFTQYLDLETAQWDQGVLARNWRKAEREGLTVSKEITPERLDAFSLIYRQNCLDYGIPLKPRNYVEGLTREGILGKHAEIYFALREGEMLGGLLVIFSRMTVSYHLPCSLSCARTLQPGVLLIVQAMREMRARGFRYWNWESSPSRDSGVYLFKKKWGSTEGSYRIYVHLPSGEERLRQIGRDGIAENFPFYFVFPFNQLQW